MSKKYLFLSLGLCLALTIAAFAGGGRLLADALALNAVPGQMSYQGYLTDSSGQPFDGLAYLTFELYDADTGGTSDWGEEYKDVQVTNGSFTLNLGSQKPLEAGNFKDPGRYLQVSVDLTNTGNVSPLPRQLLTTVPYAFRAEFADAAGSVSWSNITNIPAGFADGVDDAGSGSSTSNVVVVAKSGGDYTTITDALAAITPSANEPYLVKVMPGVYDEHVVVPEYVHIQGSGCELTEITSASSGQWFSEEAATVAMSANAQLSEITVSNTSVTDGASAVRINLGNENTRLFNVKMYTNGAGGDRHVGLVVRSSNDVMIAHVMAEASGASIFNHGINNSGSATYDSAVAMASGDASSNGTARGMELGGGDVIIRNSEMMAADASSSIAVYATGSVGDVLRIDHSVLDGETTGVHTSNSHTVYIGASMVEGGAFAFSGTMRCAQSYNGSYVDVSAACN